MPGNYSFWSVFLLTGLGLGIGTLICWLLSALFCWLLGFTFSTGVALVSVLTTLFALSLITAGNTGSEIEGTSSLNVPPVKEEPEDDEPEENNEEPPNDS